MKSESILDLSVQGLRFCEENGNLDEYLDGALSNNEFRSIVSSILFTYFRQKARIDFYIKHFTAKPPPPFLRRVLSVVFTQILFQRGIEVFIAGDIAVSYVKHKEGKAKANFINAVIRNFVRFLENPAEKNRLILPPILPPELAKRWTSYYGADAVKNISSAIENKHPFTFRSSVNIDHNTLEKLQAEKLTYEWTEDFYTGKEPGLILASELFLDGSIYIQDPGASYFTTLLKGLKPDKILDYCSAPGGKTLLLSSVFPKAEITATDRSLRRLEKVKENIERLKAKNITVISMNDFEKNTQKQSFDLILLDVPCSNSGVIRHRPDAMWNFSQKNESGITALQKEILNKTVPYLSPGGYLIYSTCSIEREENENLLESFTGSNSGLELLKAETLLPSIRNDGAFAALLRLL